MRLQKIVIGLLICCLQSVFAVSDDPIIGKLENGLTYYVKKNDFPKNKASLRLFVKAGSLNETESERGLAHFVEHMVFRGTEHFDDYEVIHYMESLGSKFGHHTNAFTGFDRTVYFLEVPLDDREALDQGVLILSDLAARAKFDESLIQIEKNVVLDEFNLRAKSVDYKNFVTIFEKLYGKSLYAKRFPLGLKEVVSEAKSEDLKGFYERCYRPDLMAIIAVGDFDEEQVVNKIKECFEGIKVPSTPFIFPDSALYPPDNRQEIVVVEPEQVLTTAVLFMHQKGKNKKRHYFDLFKVILDKRFQQIAQMPKAPFLYADINLYPLFDDYEETSIRSFTYADRPLDGVKAIYQEIKRYKEWGVSIQEFASAKEQIKEEDDTEIASKVSHSQIAERCMSHFVEGAFESDSDEKISYELFNEWLKEWVSPSEFHFCLLTSQSNTHLSEEIKGCFDDLKEEILQKNEDILLEKPIFQEGEPVEVASSFLNEHYGFETLVLSNGLKVILHPSTEEKEQVELYYVAKGGKSLFDESHYPSVHLAPQIAMLSGLGNLSYLQLNEYLSKKEITIQYQIQEDARFIIASGKSRYLEDLLKFSKAAFLDRRENDFNQWDNLVGRISEIEKNLYNDPIYYFMIEGDKILHSDLPFYRNYFSKGVDMEKASNCMDIAFGNPSEFTLIIVGDFDKEEAKKLLCNHSNFSKSENKLGKPSHLPDFSFPKESKKIVLKKGNDTPCFNYVCLGSGVISKDKLSKLGFAKEALSHILTNRLLCEMRQERGCAYSPSLKIDFIPLSNDNAEIVSSITFTCEVEMRDSMQALVIDVINKFLETGPTGAEIEVAREVCLKEIEQAFETNFGLKVEHINQVLYKRPFRSHKEQENECREKMNVELVNQLAQIAFENALVVKIELLSDR